MNLLTPKERHEVILRFAKLQDFYFQHIKSQNDSKWHTKLGRASFDCNARVHDCTFATQQQF